MKDKLLKEKSIQKKAYFYNTLGSMLNSFQTMILLLVITRLDRVEDSSIFVIAYAIGNLMLTIGKFGVRNFQVTDIERKYTYYDYLFFRKFTTFLMLVFSVIYIAYGFIFDNYSIYKSIAVFLICFYKMIEAYEDVLHGELQRNQRLDIAAKIFSIRQVVYIAIFLISYYIFNNLVLSLSLSVLASLILALVLNKNIVDGLTNLNNKQNISNFKSLLNSVFPLALVTFLLMYIGNAPKYIVDGIISDLEQTNLNIIFMPVFVISLLSSFIFNPILNKLSILWNACKLNDFKKIVFRQIIIIFLFTLLAIIGGNLIGIKLLEIIYDVDLSTMYFEFNILMVCGGGLALNNLFNIVLTIFRQSRLLLLIFAFSAIILIIFGKWILIDFKITGLCLFFASVIIFSNIILGFCYLFNIHGKERR